MFSCVDNQEVGLEAATLERVRNSSLVKWLGADNVAGLKYTAEAATFTRWLAPAALGWLVWVCGWVGERPVSRGSRGVSCGGGGGSENAGMSSECRVRIPAAG
jgi:hypothetical protein